MSSVKRRFADRPEAGLDGTVDRLPDRFLTLDPDRLVDYTDDLGRWLLDDQRRRADDGLDPDVWEVMTAIGFDVETVFRARMRARA